MTMTAISPHDDMEYSIVLDNIGVTYKLPKFFISGIRKQLEIQHEAKLQARKMSKKYNKSGPHQASRHTQQLRQLNLSSQKKPVVEALKNISINIKPGEKIGIAGHNGAGKTTLLRLISGLIEPTSGYISTRGVVHSIINMGGGIDPVMTGVENLKRLAILLRVPKEDRSAYLESAIKFSELDTFLYVPVKAYSSGMRFRLLFAAVTSVRPDILIMDEWLGVTDKRFQQAANERMNDMVGQASILILASNNEKLLLRTCDRILVLNNGQIEHDFSCEDFDNYLKINND